MKKEEKKKREEELRFYQDIFSDVLLESEHEAVESW